LFLHIPLDGGINVRVLLGARLTRKKRVPMSCATTSFATRQEALTFLEQNPDI
jgi:hypothetical protein